MAHIHFHTDARGISFDFASLLTHTSHLHYSSLSLSFSLLHCTHFLHLSFLIYPYVPYLPVSALSFYNTFLPLSLSSLPPLLSLSPPTAPSLFSWTPFSLSSCHTTSLYHSPSRLSLSLSLSLLPTFPYILPPIFRFKLLLVSSNLSSKRKHNMSDKRLFFTFRFFSVCFHVFALLSLSSPPRLFICS